MQDLDTIEELPKRSFFLRSAVFSQNWTPSLPPRRKTPKGKFLILGQVRDVDGGLWSVRAIRSTKYGFDLLFGSAVSHLGSYRGGLPRLIATRPLVDFWETHRIKRTGIIYDLPAGRTTLKRVRRRLGFHSLDDLSEFWHDHIEDLGKLKVRDFAARYNVPADSVSEARLKLLGRRARTPEWWQNPGPLAVLQSPITLREMGEKLDISTSHAKRLRDRALSAELV